MRVKEKCFSWVNALFAFPSGEGAPTHEVRQGRMRPVRSTTSPRYSSHRTCLLHLTHRKRSPLPKGEGLFYSLLRMILPEMVLGSSSRNSTILGYL